MRKLSHSVLYYQNKYDYYSNFAKGMVLVIGNCSIGYYFSDCLIFGGLQTDTLLPRLFILVPLAIYLIISKFTNDYRIMIPASYLVLHSVMWCTIWACCYLPDLRWACPGFIIIHFLFIPIGMTAPEKEAAIAQALLFVDILIANTFLHYPDLYMMFLLSAPLWIGVCFFNHISNRTYRDQAEAKDTLEFTLNHDPLTGVCNRNIMRQIADEHSKLKNLDPSLDTYVIMFDLDHFKGINDKYGHESGDFALVEVAEVARRSVRKGDTIIRWGGDEFVILIQCPGDRIKDIAESIRENVCKHNFGKLENVTISIGVAKYSDVGVERTIKKADLALYTAKSGGRNRVCFC